MERYKDNVSECHLSKLVLRPSPLSLSHFEGPPYRIFFSRCTYLWGGGGYTPSSRVALSYETILTYSPLNTTISTVRVLVGYCRTHRKFSWGCAVKAAARYLNINFMRHFLQRTFDSENDKLSKFSKIATKIQLLSDNCERTWFFYNILSISSQLVMKFKPFTKITYL